MTEAIFQLRVTSVRSRGRIGGAIFAGTTGAGERYVAICDYHQIPDASLVEKGQTWQIEGTVRIEDVTTKRGFSVSEKCIDAISAELLRPLGRNLVAWIANCPDCLGIGQVKAQKLHQRFGPALLEVIEKRRLEELTQVISEESARALCAAFEKFKIAGALHWLDMIGMPRKLGHKVVAHYGERARESIESNPYVLVSFEADWKQVDVFARRRFGIPESDPRRLTSAIEEVLYAGLGQGHTCMPDAQVRQNLRRLLGAPSLVAAALDNPHLSSRARYRHSDGMYQAAGLYLIESYVASRLCTILAGESGAGQVGLFPEIPDDADAVARAIRKYERMHFTLGDKQGEAVQACVEHRVSLIVGGAGTGKTTVLKALYDVLEELQPGVAIYQLALAGRAAQRMAQATGREAMTIAGFLTKIDPASVAIGSVVVVDEMSMVDVILMYKLLRHIPDGVRLILVGDPSQLPPIGPGLVLHALVGLAGIPQTELDVVMRQSAVSGIPQIAAAIRTHQKPVYAAYDGRPGVGVSFVSCASSQLEATVQKIYHELGGRGADFTVQVLSITKSNVGGIANLNSALHRRYQHDAPQVHCFDAEFGVVGARTVEHVPLRVGDLTIFTENDYVLGLRNGAVGRIVEAFCVAGPDDQCCRCDFEGQEYLLNSGHIGALNHAYAITVHKAQGSQFTRVIVPIRTSRLLDQALIYSAVTRGIEQVVLVGDEEAASKAIVALASAARRDIALPKLLADSERRRELVQ